MPEKKVLVIGSGISGLSAAIGLARLGIGVELVEKAHELGGHARQFTCKATESCARCGACLIEEKIQDATFHPNIRIRTGMRLEHIDKNQHFSARFTDKNGISHALMTHAVVLASGFKAFNPEPKPYGYRLFDNVITNLELERIMRREGLVRRPSDKKVPEKMAFIQCVGSRDAKLNHLWCSKVCCGSALRMARVIKSRQHVVEISFFYMDVQNFGKDFHTVYPEVQHHIKMIRAIPADIYRSEDDQLLVNYFNAGDEESTEELFDMVVLSVGITPGEDNQKLAEILGVALDDSGFFRDSEVHAEKGTPGVFFAGTARSPMSIADSIADAGSVVWDVAKYLKKVEKR